MTNGESSIAIEVPAEQERREAKGKAPLLIAGGTHKHQRAAGGWKKGVAIIDFILRLGATAAALGAAASMGTSDETLPFFTQFFQFQASYDDLPTFTYAIFFFLIKKKFN